MSQTLPLIALGGALGSVLRYLLVAGIGAPWGTAAVNVLGSFTIGALFVLLDARAGWQLFLMTGLLGGFTTFSAFSLETALMIERGRYGPAAAYVGVSVVAAIAALFVGLMIARRLFGADA